MDTAVWVSSLITAGLSIGISLMASVLSWRAFHTLAEVDKKVAVIQERTGDTHKELLSEMLAQNRQGRGIVRDDELRQVFRTLLERGEGP